MLHAEPVRQARNERAGTGLRVMDITAEAARLPDFQEHEQVWLGADEQRGLTAIVAIHDTTLGPALGGTRIWQHRSREAAITDALRLSQGMTLKSAVAGLALGGGKAVILADAPSGRTPAMLEAYAEMLAMLEGRFITAEDVGLTLADADFLRSRTTNVAGTSAGGSGNPSPMTALGVFLGLKAALRHRFGTDDLRDRHVAIQGLGAVGQALATHLAGEGARLSVADIDQGRASALATRFGATVVSAGDIACVEADVFAPCALGSVLDARSVRNLGAPIVAGAANNQLARPEIGETLRREGVLYAPDFVINAGGIINVAAELAPGGYDRAGALSRIARIPDVLASIFLEADREAVSTDAVARRLACAMLKPRPYS